MPRYIKSKDLDALAAKVLEKYHQRLKAVRIQFLFRDETPATDGEREAVLGRAVRVDDRNWVLHGADAIIEINQDVWDEIPENHREIILDHELCHIGVETDEDGNAVTKEGTGRPKVYLIPHDIEEFIEIMNRYGEGYAKFREYVSKKLEEIRTKRSKKEKPAKTQKAEELLAE